MKDNPRKHAAKKTWPMKHDVVLEVWSYRIGTLREFHVCFSKDKRTVAQGSFRVKA